MTARSQKDEAEAADGRVVPNERVGSKKRWTDADNLLDCRALQRRGGNNEASQEANCMRAHALLLWRIWSPRPRPGKGSRGKSAAEGVLLHSTAEPTVAVGEHSALARIGSCLPRPSNAVTASGNPNVNADAKFRSCLLTLSETRHLPSHCSKTWNMECD